MEEIKVSSKGQLVIPKEIRDEMGIRAGSKVLLSMQGHSILIIPKPSDPVKALVEFGKKLRLGNMFITYRRKEALRLLQKR